MIAGVPGICSFALKITTFSLQFPLALQLCCVALPKCHYEEHPGLSWVSA
jgi:hypothetical protein